MNLQPSDYFLLAVAIAFLLAGYAIVGVAMLLGGALYHYTAYELTHRFMNDIRREVGLPPLGRRERLAKTKTAADLPPLPDNERSWHSK